MTRSSKAVNEVKSKFDHCITKLEQHIQEHLTVYIINPIQAVFSVSSFVLLLEYIWLFSGLEVRLTGILCLQYKTWHKGT